jgi:hypothetical protein
MRRVWLPPENNDEQHRQLDLFIWGDALEAAKEAGKRKIFQAISEGAFEILSITNLTKSGLPRDRGRPTTRLSHREDAGLDEMASRR